MTYKIRQFTERLLMVLIAIAILFVTKNALYDHAETHTDDSWKNDFDVVYTREIITTVLIAEQESYDGFDVNTDYMELMKMHCRSGDYEAGRSAAEARNRKIDALDLQNEKVTFDDLHELSKIITSEAGSAWLPEEWKMKVGEVVLNRVASPEFPNTIYEVVHDSRNGQIQYANVSGKTYRELIPYSDCVEAAAKLLNGERLLNDVTIIFQSTNPKFGSGVADVLKDATGYYKNTYLCYTSYPELYKGV